MKRSLIALAAQFILVMEVLSFEEIHVENRKPGEPLLEISHNLDHPLLKTLKSYEIIEPVQYDDYHHKSRKSHLSTELKNQIGVHEPETYFTIDFEGRTLILDVSINQELLPQSFYISSYSEKGEQKSYKPSKNELNHCYYQGHVRGIANSQVVMSTCQGLKGSVLLPDDILIFEPLNFPNKDVQYVVYRSKDIISSKLEGTCGTSDFPQSLPSIMNNFKSHSGYVNKTLSRKRRNISNEKKFIELLIVADRALVTRLGSTTATEDHVKQIANHLDAFYTKLGIRVVLSSIELWSDRDRITVTNSATQVLDALLKYRTRQIDSQPASSAWVYTDNVHLLHGDGFEGFVVAMASVGTMCGPLSGGVSEDRTTNLIRVASTVAHEMGHNFALEHDSEDCVCPSGADCIMASKSGSGTVKDWSDCSKGYLKQSAKLGLLNCLVNVPPPSRIFTGAECGNDIIEQGEECDCGKPASCTSSCCDAATCQLISGAICDGGLCCNNCQYLTAGTVCRAADNECDVAEYCKGDSPNCPSNLFYENGLPCLNGAAACIGGVCLTYDVQCQNIWGPTATNAIPNCYNFINTYGNSNGNCGRDESGKSFMKCSTENVRCGKLLCLGGSSKPVVGSSRANFVSSFRKEGDTSGPIFDCKSVKSPDADSDKQDAGLIRTGTICAPGKSCQNSVCAAALSPTCSSSCNGNGKCNNLGQCYCNNGFAPPDCSSPGDGGSMDDEYVDPTDTSNGRTTSESNKLFPDFQLILAIALVAYFLPILTGESDCSRLQNFQQQIDTWKSDRALRLSEDSQILQDTSQNKFPSTWTKLSA